MSIIQNLRERGEGAERGSVVGAVREAERDQRGREDVRDRERERESERERETERQRDRETE